MTSPGRALQTSAIFQNRRRISTQYSSKGLDSASFQKKPSGYWKDISHQRAFFDEIGRKHGVTQFSDWYKVAKKDIIASGGERILKTYYNGSYPDALSKIYPEHSWQKDLFNVRRYFRDKREAFDYIASKLGYTKWEDWYEVRKSDIVNHGGSGILDEHGSSISKTLMAVYPEHNWLLHRFRHVPAGYWKDVKNQRDCMEYIGEKLGVKVLEDWYQISGGNIRDLGGSGLLAVYNGNYVSAITSIFKEHDWQIEKFAHIENYWSSKATQRAFFDRIAKKMNLTKWEDWYGVTQQQLQQHGGSSILSYYHNSPMKAITTIYPEHPWQLWRFNKVPKLFWEDEKILRQAIEYLAKELNIKEPVDWYNVTGAQIEALHCRSLVEKHGLINVLERLYPDQQWEHHRKVSSSKTQLKLFHTVVELFPSKDIQIDYVHSDLVHAATKKNVEFDVFIPDLKLAFEYQGVQHYAEDHAVYGDVTRKARDKEKVDLCLQVGITLVQVPYWWNGSKSSLAATINVLRPELHLKVDGDASPIPQEPPQRRSTTDAK
eukprot:TRINITY_DN1558_c0_g1_i1.p1 TRINITY_DN1558_c0_g1~~TRINITY_DN1558_c0_g1_i1.p1  ORF type:complete len:545 (+),score=133.12 TRINITY_DN1558_c0_g1_i1:262-1896(+)